MKNKNSDLFGMGEKAPSAYFTGNAWVKNLVPADDMFHAAIGNVVFEAGARNNWHTHPGGQILICTDGTGRYQERGRPIQVLKKGDVVRIPPDVEHWHGASADHAFTHLAINPNIKQGIVTWLDKVTDEEYQNLS